MRLGRTEISFSSEFLIHAADVEGLCQGIDEELVSSTFASPAWYLQGRPNILPELGKWVTIPTTYAGGAKSESILHVLYHARISATRRFARR